MVALAQPIAGDFQRRIGGYGGQKSALAGLRSAGLGASNLEDCGDVEYEFGKQGSDFPSWPPARDGICGSGKTDIELDSQFQSCVNGVFGNCDKGGRPGRETLESIVHD